MAQHNPRLLSSHPEAYARSFQCFLASTNQRDVILQCIEKHIVPLLINNGISDLLQSHSSTDSPFRVLSVGSGEGVNDIHLLEAFSKIRQKEGERISMFTRCIEPDKDRLSAFREKAAILPEHVKERVNVDFEWVPMTFQEYTSQKNEDDVTFDVVHFIHSIYHLDEKEALVHCYEKELGEKGIIISVAQSKENLMSILAELPDLGRHVASYPRNGDVISVAIEQGWKYFTCPGDTISVNIASMFDSSSREGDHLLDFLTHIKDIRQTEEIEIVDNITNFWKEQWFINELGKRIIELKDNAVIIVKGFA
ncbi:histamine N-methyltransferase-like [Oculina patagonica]